VPQLAPIAATGEDGIEAGRKRGGRGGLIPFSCYFGFDESSIEATNNSKLPASTGKGGGERDLRPHKSLLNTKRALCEAKGNCSGLRRRPKVGGCGSYYTTPEGTSWSALKGGLSEG